MLIDRPWSCARLAAAPRSVWQTRCCASWAAATGWRWLSLQPLRRSLGTVSSRQRRHEFLTMCCQVPKPFIDNAVRNAA